jgi:hypothetical protein
MLYSSALKQYGKILTVHMSPNFLIKNKKGSYVQDHYCPVKEQRPLTSTSSVKVAERRKTNF